MRGSPILWISPMLPVLEAAECLDDYRSCRSAPLTYLVRSPHKLIRFIPDVNFELMVDLARLESTMCSVCHVASRDAATDSTFAASRHRGHHFQICSAVTDLSRISRADCGLLSRVTCRSRYCELRGPNRLLLVACRVEVFNDAN